MRVILAGGGTGGHLYPAIALAEAIEAKQGHVLFITGSREIEDRVFAGLSFARMTLSVGGMATVGQGRKILALLQTIPAIFKSLRAMLRETPDFVALTGGYVAFPVGVAAVLLRRPLVLIEPNAIAGRVSRMFGRFAQAVVTVSGDKRLLESGVTIPGIPVRRSIVGLRRSERQEPGTILVLGGSQGAASLNEAMPRVLADHPGVNVRHITGPGKASDVLTCYQQAGVPAVVQDYADDIAQEYASADLVVARAGAGTVSELLAAAIPAVLVPYPYAADDHQTANAAIFEGAGGGDVVPEGAHFEQRLGESLAALLQPEKRAACRDALTKAPFEFDAVRILAVLKEAL